MHWKILIVAVLLGGAAYQYPGAISQAAYMAGIGQGTPCGAAESYFERIGNKELSEASQYKFAFDTPSAWVDQLSRVDRVECTCSEEIRLKEVEDQLQVPDDITNLSTASLVLYTIDGVYQDDPARLKGGAIAFQPVSSGWFISQEHLYSVDGQQAGGVQVSQFSTKCAAG